MAKNGVVDLANGAVDLLERQFPGTPHRVTDMIVALAVAALVVTITKPLVAPLKGAWSLFVQPRLRSKEMKQRLELQSAFAQHLHREISRLNKAENWRDEHFVELEAEVEVAQFFDLGQRRFDRRALTGVAQKTEHQAC